MNQRIAKELRPLLLPGCLAAVAAGIAPLKLLSDDLIQPGELLSMLFNFVPFVFFGSIVALAASSFGVEFQHRTLPLMLTQPLRRARLWNEKMAVLGAAAVVIVLIPLVVALGLRVTVIRWLGTEGSPLFTAQQTLLISVFILATICSAGFWTLQARSTIGGMAFCFAGQFLATLAVSLAIDKIYGSELRFEDSIVTGWAVVVGLLYSLGFLWLGWRKFARLELRDVSYGEGAPIHILGAARAWGLDWLRCRPTSGLLNLVRKELRLQKPLFLVAAVFVLCWLVALAWLFLQPSRQELIETIFNVLTVFYVPLMALLAGSVSLGEEKTFGVTAWHLTLPVSARTQWLIKLCVSVGIGLALALALPILLGALTAPKAKVGLIWLITSQDNGLQVLLIAAGLLFVLGFWAVTLLGNTIRAALNTIVMLVVLGMVAALAAFFCTRGIHLETELLLFLMAHFQLPPDSFQKLYHFAVAFVPVPIMLTALIQSFRQFRRAAVSRRLVWKYVVILLAVGFFASGWGTDLVSSAISLSHPRLEQEVLNAVRALPEQTFDASRPGSRTVTLQDLAKTGKLSGLTKSWLKDSSMTLRRDMAKGSGSTTFLITYVTVQFPDGRQYQFVPDTGGPLTLIYTQPQQKTE